MLVSCGIVVVSVCVVCNWLWLSVFVGDRYSVCVWELVVSVLSMRS